MSRSTVLALAAAFVLAAALPCAAASGADARLAAARSRWTEHVRTERPDLAMRWDVGGAQRRLEPVTEATLERDAALLAALGDSLAAIDRDALAPASRAVLDTLRARVEREAAPIRDGAWRRDPELYLALTHGAVLEAARAPRVTPCGRSARALARLEHVPEVLRAAEINLRGADAIDADATATRWAAAMADLRTELPVLAARCHDPERVARVVEADTLALDAMRRFVAVLRVRAAASRAR